MDNGLFALGLVCAAVGIAATLGTIYLDQWIADREIEKARKAHEARKRIAGRM